MRAPFRSSDRPAALVRVGIVVATVGLLLGGCAVPSFVGQQYTNFTAYYNKFHNANAAFEKGLASIEERDRAIDRTQYVSVFLVPTEQVDESPFDKAIQKSADVLRTHPDSKWIDDALLLIGKSYFYQQNYVGAAQKFREVLALRSDRAQEARFWLARTLVATERYGTAAEVIRTGIEGGGEGSWTARLHLVRGQLLARQERWEEATQALNRGLEGDLPGEVAARAAFLLGQTLETLGRSAPARAAYRQVREYDPSYALGFAARLNEIELQGTHGDAARALDRLRDLETDEKNYEQRGEMAVARARIYQAQGKYPEARRTLRNMLYRDEAPSGASRGRLHYDLARLYRDAFKDFSRAAAHFDTASTALGSTPTGSEEEAAQRMPAAPVDAGTQADRYRDLAERARTVARLDSLLRLGRMSDQEFQQYVQERRRRQQARQEAQAEDDRARSRRLRSRQGGLAEQRQGAAPAADTRESDAGFLFHKDPARVQRGRRQFEQTWGDRPLVDNWRRQVAIRSTETASAEGEAGPPGQASSSPGQTRGGRTGPDAAPAAGLDLSAIPRDSARLAEMEAERTVARYKLANSLFLAASRPDSAATWYRRILQESGDHPVAKRALYALAEAYRAQGDTTAAQQTYRRLVDRYPDTDLAGRARQRLNLTEQAPVENRSARADSAYARVYEQWRRGRRDTMLVPFLEVATQYPETDAAPRALLAAGIGYWRQAQHDSTSVPRRPLWRHLRTLRPADSTRLAAPSSPSGAAPTSPLVDSTRTRAVPQGARRDSVIAKEKTVTQPGSTADSVRSGRLQSVDTLRTANANGPPSPGPDSSRVATDTPAGRAPASPDSTAPPAGPDVYAPLEALLTHLTERYPDAPQVAQAESLLELIDARRGGTGAPLADTASTDSAAVERSPEEGRATGDDATTADTAMVAARREDRSSPSPPADTAGAGAAVETGGEEDGSDDRPLLPAPTDPRAAQDSAADPPQRAIDRDRGGWTLLVQTFSSSQEASTRVAALGRRLGDQWPVDLLRETSEGTTQYHLIVGQFDSERAAVQAQERVGQRLSGEPQVRGLSTFGPRS